MVARTVFIGLLLISVEVRAEEPRRLNSYALMVGSNRAGPGQQDLRYAREDALRVGKVLRELGGFSPGNLRVLLDPERDELFSALDRMKQRLRGHLEQGEQAEFLFFYSGHARARGLNLGAEEVTLSELRTRLVSMPATLTVAVLDACQTGAISQVKGAEPTADFSYNLTNSLNTEGIAVMASSSASELSQESEALGASYFTHHLLTGLRGAADSDSDGRVTLSEAYRYAYHRTLVATAATAVGKQHVTLETELRGKGEMVLTYPAEASSALVLPGDLEGDVLVHREPRKTVMAEVGKIRGKPVRLAFPPGTYVTFVRMDGDNLKCELELAKGSRLELDMSRCIRVEDDEVGVKGSEARWSETLALEVGAGLFWGAADGYNQQLEKFGFQAGLFSNDELHGTISVALQYSINPNVALLAGWSILDTGSYQREAWDLEGHEGNQKFEWSAYGVGLYLRGTLPLLDGVLNPYLQAGFGATWGSTVYRDPLQASDVTDEEIQWGYHLAVGMGVQVMVWRHLGFYGQANYVFAPALENLLGDVHNSGGLGFVLGVRGAL